MWGIYNFIGGKQDMIRIIVDMDDLTRIERDFGMLKDKTKFVLRSAINNTAKKTKKVLEKQPKKDYFIVNKGGIKHEVDINKATTSMLSALVVSHGPVNELYDFKVSPRAYNPASRPRRGVKANVKKATGWKSLERRPGERDAYKAFIVQFKSGHVAVAQRIPGTKMRKKNKEQIKKLVSLSMAKANEVALRDQPKYEQEIHENLINNVNAQIARFLG